jgi:hypothetical protein
MRRFALFLIPLVLAACQTISTVSGNRMEPAADAAWTEQVDLRLDERFIADSRELEIQPIQIGVDQASFLVRVGGITQTIELQSSGPLSTRTVAPYRFELVSTSLEPSATVQISRLR